MVEYNCECCRFTTNHKTKFVKHIETNKHKRLSKFCSNLTVKYPNLSEPCPFFEEKFKCKYCDKTFKYRSGVSKHIKYSCKKNKDEDLKELVRLLNEQNNEKEQQILEILSINKDMMDKHDKMQKQIEKLTKKLQIQHIGTQNNTTNNTVNYNVKILNYHDTDYSHLTEGDYVNCINDTNHCVKSLIEKVHFNSEKPENMNVYIPSLKDNYIMVYRDNTWKIQDRKEIIDDLYERNEYELENWYDEFYEKYPEIVKSFQRYLENKDSDSVVNDVKRKILMELYNKRELIVNRS